ncbi:alpha/beta hydrolase [Amycolatopsis sp. NPDC004368]
MSSYPRAWLANWATLRLDRPGHGNSTPLLSGQPTAPVFADALAALVRGLARGNYGTFERVVLVGHSAGTALALYAAQLHPDLTDELAGIVLTGMVHAPALADVAVPSEVVHPANGESRFAHLDDGWITTVPGRRAGLWWSPASPAELVRRDEDAKGIWSPAELAGARELWVTPVAVPVPPVLLIAGQQDESCCPADARAGRCGDDRALLDHERHYFPPGTRLTTRLVPGCGHVLSPVAEASHRILEWLGDL